MSKKSNEIDDNEIRIISAFERRPGQRRKHIARVCLLLIGVAVFIVAAIVLLAGERVADDDKLVVVKEAVTEEAPVEMPTVEPADEVKGFTVARDTIIGGRGLLILSAENARPRLVIGSETLNDSTIVLAAQAADVRGDNGQIAGAFVLDGELMSKGEAKAGYCSIINGELTIGVADATPMLEQALTEGGYFFRQYPLVVGGQIVENRPKGVALRKALAEIGGRICVVMSREKLTFHDFSQLLIDAGVRNAIYLVGAASYGFYVNETGERILIGNKPWNDIENVSYIVWQQG